MMQAGMVLHDIRIVNVPKLCFPVIIDLLAASEAVLFLDRRYSPWITCTTLALHYPGLASVMWVHWFQG